MDLITLFVMFGVGLFISGMVFSSMGFIAGGIFFILLPILIEGP